MKFFVPDNIFSSIIISVITNNADVEIIKTESALLSKKLGSNSSAIAFIPSLELINNRTFFVSSKTGIAFDGLLSNSYYYFQEAEREIINIYMRGDISINEAILSKILFEERYSSNIELKIDISKKIKQEQDYLIVGNENFDFWNINNGISFSDQVAETLNLPYVNYLLASQDKEQLIKAEKLFTNCDVFIEENMDQIIKKLGLSIENEKMIKENYNSVYYEFTPNEIDAVNELIKLLYYRGIADDMFEVKFI